MTGRSYRDRALPAAATGRKPEPPRRQLYQQFHAGRVKLSSSLIFQIADRQGRPLVGPETLGTQRTYVNDKDNIIGTTEEEELLRREMRQDLTRQLLFRLSSITEGQLSSYESRLNQQEN
ncbi:hypothetical protein ULG90_10165 [Halopseudomonas pachastrellae]|nr:hypothetical protein ULG90_10165 [Halopseudomonas pachastrellae]